MLLPTAPTTYTIERIGKDPIRLNSNLGYYTNFVNLLDLCAVAVPAGFTSASLPFGVSLVAPAFSEYALLALASRIQQGRVTFSGARAAALPATVYAAIAQNNGWVHVGVVGAHLAGQPLNWQLTNRGAKLVRTTTTAPDYQFFALTNTSPAKPGLVCVPGFNGPGIEIEIWMMPQSEFGSFVAAVPAPLSIGTCALKDGSSVKGFLCEPYAVQGMPEITQLGSWRKYLQSR
jgi:allophanate hydrolase